MAIEGVRERVNPSDLEEISGLTGYIDDEVKSINEGKHFFAGGFSTLADGQVRDIFVVAPNDDKVSHMIFEAEGNNQLEFYLFEQTSYSANSLSAISAYNNDRNSATASVNSLFTSSYISTSASLVNTGTILFSQGKGLAGSPPLGALQAGLPGFHKKVLLKKNSVTCFRVLSKAADNVVSWQMQWKEHAPIYEV